MDIRVIDSNFAHATSCSNGDLKIFPKHFNWYRGKDTKDITVFVDNEYRKARITPSNIKIWMLLEPPTISPQLYELVKNPEVQKEFDYILTFDKSLIGLKPKVIWYPLGGCWIEEKDRKIHPKTKNISIIASEKNFTKGHQLRHEIIRRYGNQIDVYGRGYRFIPSKMEALRDYRFTIVIENCKLDNYFSEKLIDPIVVGTIPLYWGSPTIHSIFDFYSTDFLPDLLEYPEKIELLYERSVEEGMVQRNFEAAKEFVNTEDWIWNNFLKNICTTIQKT